MQLGVDHKIYVNAGLLNVINCPNKLGPACGYQTNVVTGGGGLGLPKWVYYQDDIPSPTVNSITYSDSCFGSTTQFSIKDSVGVTSVNWLFGDIASGANNTATGLTASHTFSQTGSYNIRAIITNTCGVDTIFLNALQIINCNPSTITGFNIIGDTCDASLNFTFQPIGTTNANSLSWTFDDPNSGINSYISSPANPNAYHIFSAAGTYNVCLTFQEPGFPIDTICRTFHIGQCCNGIISSNDTCLENSISFSILSGATISSANWNFGDLNSGSNNFSNNLNPTHFYSDSGTYNITVIVNWECGIDTLSKLLNLSNCDSSYEDCEIYVPNVFTPNNDGINESFNPISVCNFEHYELLIYNRWGNEIIATNNQQLKWDGKYKGIECTDGVYFYVLTYKFPNEPMNIKTGTITILR